MASIKVSFIFVNRNNTAIILNALKSLYKSGSKYKFEVFVVDNNSEFFLSLLLDHLILVPSPPVSDSLVHLA